MPEYTPRDLADWTGGVWRDSWPQQSVRGMTIDSRTVQPGQLFLAFRGPRFDGHEYVRAAFAAGASAAVVDKSFAVTAGACGPLLVVEDTHRALVAMALGHRNLLKTQLIALTGSVGKTTVKEMTADILSLLAPTSRTRGNWNNDIGLPLSLLALEPSAKFGVFEVGMNHPGELAPLCDLIRPSWGIVTTIGPVHIEFFDSVRAIAMEKAEVFRSLSPDGVAVFNRDEEWADLLRAEAPGRVVTISLAGDADYVGSIESAADGRFSVTERDSGERASLVVSVPGRHVIQNALLAVAVGRGCGATWEQIAQALLYYAPPPLRWNRVRIGEFEVINDAYNANPISMRAALKTFAEQSVSGGRWLVLGGMRELGVREREEHLLLGREVAGGPWAGLVAVGALGEWIAEGVGDFGGRPLFRCPDCASAADTLVENVQPGDALLLKASRGEKLEEVLKQMENRLKTSLTNKV